MFLKKYQKVGYSSILTLYRHTFMMKNYNNYCNYCISMRYGSSNPHLSGISNKKISNRMWKRNIMARGITESMDNKLDKPTPIKSSFIDAQHALKYGFITGMVTALSVLVLLGYTFSDHILNILMHAIFDRRELYLKECYPERIILIRHGQSDSNLDENTLCEVPDHEIGLTKLGAKQAFSAGRRLKSIVKNEPLYMYYSPYKRAYLTMKYIIRGGKFDETDQIKVNLEDCRLIEQKFGNLQTYSDMQNEKQLRTQYGRFYYQFKEGESALDVNLRAAAFVDRLFDHFRTGYYSTRPDEKWNVVIISHGLFMRVQYTCILMNIYLNYNTYSFI